MPNRKIERLAFPFPYNYPCDFDSSNKYVSNQVNNQSGSHNLILINPLMKKKFDDGFNLRLNSINDKVFKQNCKWGDSGNFKKNSR